MSLQFIEIPCLKKDRDGHPKSCSVHTTHVHLVLDPLLTPKPKDKHKNKEQGFVLSDWKYVHLVCTQDQLWKMQLDRWKKGVLDFCETMQMSVLMSSQLGTKPEVRGESRVENSFTVVAVESWDGTGS